MSTPSWSRTVAPFDQIVTAPPPAVTLGRWSKTVTSCPSRSNPRATEMPLTPAPTTRIRDFNRRPALVLCMPFVVPPLQPSLQSHQAVPDDGRGDPEVDHQQRTHLTNLPRIFLLTPTATTRYFDEKFTAAPSIPAMTDLSDMPPDDQQAIGKTLLTLL